MEKIPQHKNRAGFKNKNRRNQSSIWSGIQRTKWKVHNPKWSENTDQHGEKESQNEKSTRLRANAQDVQSNKFQYTNYRQSLKNTLLKTTYFPMRIYNVIQEKDPKQKENILKNE